MVDFSGARAPYSLPFKSVAGALWFSVLLGPVGLLYASTLGGIVMLIVAFIVLSAKFIVPIILTWVISCVWSVIATNRYNRRLLMLAKLS